ncbi:hypothetical protein BKP35_10425 [Anaerobacillus arseniciselenatis]|uniref:Uncharacterized protein n=1 Tax=Anaerobacillus arseniciselenatis TaxID=85682 RepID=A0A1S2LKQ3_9BACI|nr:hypothetical protein [Anaerobacillus arseniciselenatis]OIJ12966.1 hypothetical protein BKP35_10425 [Anaerobacillus arseniciselenatis]
MKLVKKWFNKLFSINVPEEVSEPTKETPVKPSILLHMEQLKDELKTVSTAYDNQLQAKEKQLKKLQFQHEKLYSQYADKFKQYRMKNLTASKVEEAKIKMQPLQNEITELTEEIHLINGFKRDNILKLNNNIQELSDDYVEAIANEINKTNNELLDLKLQYLEKVKLYKELYNSSAEIDATLTQSFNQYGINYKPIITSKVKEATEAGGASFVIETSEVTGVLAGGSVPYYLLKKVQEIKKQ